MIDFKIDSGAEINVIFKTIYNKRHRHPKLKSTSVTFTAYHIFILGKCIYSEKKTATHKSLKLLAKYTLHGWPEKQKSGTIGKTVLQ